MWPGNPRGRTGYDRLEMGGREAETRPGLWADPVLAALDPPLGDWGRGVGGCSELREAGPEPDTGAQTAFQSKSQVAPFASTSAIAQGAPLAKI